MTCHASGLSEHQTALPSPPRPRQDMWGLQPRDAYVAVGTRSTGAVPAFGTVAPVPQASAPGPADYAAAAAPQKLGSTSTETKGTNAAAPHTPRTGFTPPGQFPHALSPTFGRQMMPSGAQPARLLRGNTDGQTASADGYANVAAQLAQQHRVWQNQMNLRQYHMQMVMQQRQQMQQFYSVPTAPAPVQDDAGLVLQPTGSFTGWYNPRFPSPTPSTPTAPMPTLNSAVVPHMVPMRGPGGGVGAVFASPRVAPTVGATAPTSAAQPPHMLHNYASMMAASRMASVGAAAARAGGVTIVTPRMLGGSGLGAPGTMLAPGASHGPHSTTHPTRRIHDGRHHAHGHAPPGAIRGGVAMGEGRRVDDVAVVARAAHSALAAAIRRRASTTRLADEEALALAPSSSSSSSSSLPASALPSTVGAYTRLERKARIQLWMNKRKRRVDPRRLRCVAPFCLFVCLFGLLLVLSVGCWQLAWGQVACFVAAWRASGGRGCVPFVRVARVSRLGCVLWCALRARSYAVRSRFANNRPRVHGRFVKHTDGDGGSGDGNGAAKASPPNSGRAERSGSEVEVGEGEEEEEADEDEEDEDDDDVDDTSIVSEEDTGALSS